MKKVSQIQESLKVQKATAISKIDETECPKRRQQSNPPSRVEIMHNLSMLYFHPPTLVKIKK
jgi:hypothetical protein